MSLTSAVGTNDKTFRVRWEDGALGLPRDLKELGTKVLMVWRRLETTGSSMPFLDHSGRLHRIDVRATHPKAYHPRQGDIVQCYARPIEGESQLKELSAAVVQGDSVKILGIVDSSEEGSAGAELSVFLVPAKAGLCYLGVTPIPVKGTPPTKPYRVPFLVAE
jgi:hypothetical protein